MKFNFGNTQPQLNTIGLKLVKYLTTTKYYCILGLPIKLIYGDSSVIISWLNRLSALEVPALMHWRGDIKNMLHATPQVIFKHIYREHNSLADGLSKEALYLDMGHGHYTEFLDGLVINKGHFVLY